MITIELTPTSYRVPAALNAQLIGTSLYLTPYIKRFNHNTWDPRIKQWMLLRRYVYYNKKRQMLYLPRYDFPNFVEYLRYHQLAYTTYDVPLEAGQEVEIPLRDWVVDRSAMQTQAIEYLTTSTDPIVGLSAQPGEGKTFCFIKAVSILGRRTMMCMAGLVDQWHREFQKFTTLTEDDIYIIQGAPSLSKLLQGIDRTIFPKVILCSQGTIRNYVSDHENYQNYPPFEDLCNLLRIGVRGTDEVHRNFHLTMMMDLRMNAQRNITLSATYDRGDREVKKIFDQHLPKTMRFGEGSYEKRTDIYCYSYTLGGMISRKAYLGPKGYSHARLEAWFLKKDTKLEYLFTVLYSRIIHAHYMNIKQPGQKLLVICSTHEMCKWFKKRIEVELQGIEQLVVNVKIEGMPDSIFDESDIIVSTPGSAGTGTDISRLRTVLSTINTAQETYNIQSLGRLRKLKEDEGVPVYVGVWCRDISKHEDYQASRRATYQARGRTYKELAI